LAGTQTKGEHDMGPETLRPPAPEHLWNWLAIHRERIANYVGKRYGLDSDLADLCASSAGLRYRDFAVQSLERGEKAPVEHSDWFLGQLFLFARQSAIDLLRSQRHVQLDVVEETARATDPDQNPFRSALAQECVERLPLFYELLRRRADAMPPLTAALRQVRRLAHANGQTTLTEEFTFEKAFLFPGVARSVDPKSARAARRLEVFTEKTGNARDVAICRLLKRLRGVWQETERRVFHDALRGLPAPA
jgi:hypothetical protein